MYESCLFNWHEGRSPDVLRSLISRSSNPLIIEGKVRTFKSRFESTYHMSLFKGLSYTKDEIIFWLISKSGNRKRKVVIRDNDIHAVSILIETAPGFSW